MLYAKSLYKRENCIRNVSTGNDSSFGLERVMTRCYDAAEHNVSNKQTDQKLHSKLTYSAASGNVIPTNDSDRYSVYISIAVPRR